MKKILTVLLSFLMVATLGIVNVSAGTSETYTYNGGEEKTFTYTGELIEVFSSITINNEENGYNYYYSVSSGTDVPNTDVSDNWTKIGSTTKKDGGTIPGTYYLYVAKGDSTNCGYGETPKSCKLTLITDFYSNQTRYSESKHKATILKKSPTVAINTPTETWKDGDNEIPTYFIGETESNIELPFTTKITDDNNEELNEFTTTWKRVDASGNDITNAENITIDSSTGKLTIKNALPNDSYDIYLKATAGGNSEYSDGTNQQQIKIVR